jgi:hypothetical protein
MTTTRIDSTTGARALSGWALFAAIVLVVAGSFNVIQGATAVHHGSYYADKLLVGNLSAWGWIVLVLGILQALAGFLVFSRNLTGYKLGVVLAMAAAFVWFFFLFAAPLASLIALITNLSVIYGLTVGSPDAWG